MNNLTALKKITILLLMINTAALSADNHQQHTADDSQHEHNHNSHATHGHHHDHDHDGEAVESDDAESSSNWSDADCAQTYKAQVNGLVCDFCARALEKVFGKKSEVANIKVDLDGGFVMVMFQSGQSLPADEVKQMIVDSGYNVTAYGPACDEV